MAIYMDKAQPSAWKAAEQLSAAISQAAQEVGLPDTESELLKVRASQLNGCAFCLDLHAREARAVGIPQQKLDLIPAWRESTAFTAREVAMLSIAEAATVLPLTPASRTELAAAQAVLGDDAFAVAEWIATAINMFNRISILSHHPVRPRDAEGKVIR
ncbi:carboxymuconolactone decarboxylase family protein [Timonella senegalensis]|uniref:carboxymuconolactone decarboxylase family protein n=1 Tax=Timonella senegalensis TaxID=1465825 RepID=UPI002FDD26FB